MRVRLAIAIALALLCAGALSWNYYRPLPAAAATTSLPQQVVFAGSPPQLPWPGVGSGAVGVSGLGRLAISGDAQPQPAASVTKVMTALIVLEDRPLNPGESGPAITINAVDVRGDQSDRSQQQSVVAVSLGEKLSEYQALEAMLIPSGNNIAETLARWDAGSVSVFVDKMNQHAAALHLTSTHFADPAGSSPASVSTPADLMALGMAAMRNPTFAQIVNLPSAQIPVAGGVFNVDTALGQDGIVGIKTGSGFNTGANFLFAAAVQIDSHPVTIFGCVMGQPTLAAAFTASRALIRAMMPALSVKQILARHQAVGAYDTAWGSHTDVLSMLDVLVVEWPGLVMRQRLDSPALGVDRKLNPGTAAGNLHILLGDYVLDVPLVTASALDPPGKLWRFARIPGITS